MNRGPPAPPAGRRGPFSLKNRFFGRFWPQEWSGWVRTGDSVHLVFVSGQTVDPGPISAQILCFWTGPNFGRCGRYVPMGPDEP